MEIFEPHVSRTILRMLGAVIDSPQNQSFSNSQQWSLPHGRKADGCLSALDLSLLDSFTFHAKKTLFQSFFNYLQAHLQNGCLPSPAFIGNFLNTFLCIKFKKIY